MKLATITTALALTLSGAVQASPLPDFPFINVTGAAKLEVAPDKARIQFVIRQTADKADAATEAVYKQGRELMQFLAQQGITEADIDAAQINKEALFKDYNNRAITGYEASQPIMVTLNELTNYVAVMDYLFKQPQIFSISGSFDSSQREQYEQQLSEKAGADARRRANSLAAAQGVKISSVFAISEASGWGAMAGDFGFGGGSVSYGAMRKADMAESSNSNLIVPKHIQLEKSVNVIYKLKP
ncbi:uncharacterized protein YggE [Rheinheimera pacifica]|uniref:SIMPL domain-containing protein n=1 Tax=Rheinheimera pacifica TaxID=173990 RepID=UPI0021674A69|nr:SIMPL domain-containing protein [Rheinheimera pacifica]MCS4308589.1 uncharacterized protein YggE [Rheinheimera pacifica]